MFSPVAKVLVAKGDWVLPRQKRGKCIPNCGGREKKKTGGRRGMGDRRKEE